MDRRNFLWVGAGVVTAPAWARVTGAAPPRLAGMASSIAAAERASGGRLGVYVIDTATGERFGHRENERFPMCSTFKFVLAGAILGRVDGGGLRLDRTVPFRAADIVSNSPVTKAAVGKSLTLATLCKAAVDVSDNAAANLLLHQIGGVAGFNRFVRGLGDTVTRLDRPETALGEATPGDPRDTSTPAAMAALANRLVLGSVLSAASRARLAGWMKGTRTGTHRLRAGLPAGWEIGHKTGTGAHGSANDVAVLWPPRRAPLIVSSYLTQATVDDAAQDAVHARVARAVVAALR